MVQLKCFTDRNPRSITWHAVRSPHDNIIVGQTSIGGFRNEWPKQNQDLDGFIGSCVSGRSSLVHPFLVWRTIVCLILHGYVPVNVYFTSAGLFLKLQNK